jgi:hypothetical protein
MTVDRFVPRESEAPGPVAPCGPLPDSQLERKCGMSVLRPPHMLRSVRLGLRGGGRLQQQVRPASALPSYAEGSRLRYRSGFRSRRSAWHDPSKHIGVAARLPRRSWDFEVTAVPSSRPLPVGA